MQEGTEGGETIQYSVDSVAGDDHGAYKENGDRIEAIAGTGINANGTGADDSIIINGNSLSKIISVTAGDSAENVAANINKVTGETGVTAVAKTYAHYYSRSVADETAKLLINGKTTNDFIISSTNVNDAVDKINSISGTTKVTATATSDFKVLLYSSSGEDMRVENQKASITQRVKAVSHDGTSVAALSGTAAVVTQNGTAYLNATKYFIKNQSTGQEWNITTATTHTLAAYNTLLDAAVGTSKIVCSGNTATMVFTGAGGTR
jgi:flagellin